MNWGTTNREAPGSFHHTLRRPHATCGQCMCMRRCWDLTEQRWLIIFSLSILNVSFIHLFMTVYASTNHIPQIIEKKQEQQFRNTEQQQAYYCCWTTNILHIIQQIALHGQPVYTEYFSISNFCCVDRDVYKFVSLTSNNFMEKPHKVIYCHDK